MSGYWLARPWKLVSCTGNALCTFQQSFDSIVGWSVCSDRDSNTYILVNKISSCVDVLLYMSTSHFKW